MTTKNQIKNYMLRLRYLQECEKNKNTLIDCRLSPLSMELYRRVREHLYNNYLRENYHYAMCDILDAFFHAGYMQGLEDSKE